MKINCEVMQDLLPLYVDEVCTDSTSKLVEEHLEECEKCKGLLKSMKQDISSEPVAESEDMQTDETLKKGIKKAKRRTTLWVSIVTILVICLGSMAINEFLERGVCFTNIDNIIIAHQFMNCLKNGDYEKAAEMQESAYEMAYKEVKKSMEEAMKDEDWEQRKPFYEEVIGVTEVEYIEARKEEFIAHMKIYDDYVDLKNYSLSAIYGSTVVFTIEEEYLDNGQSYTTQIGVQAISEHFISCPTGGIPEEEAKKKEFDLFEQYYLYSAVNDQGIYYDGPTEYEE